MGVVKSAFTTDMGFPAGMKPVFNWAKDIEPTAMDQAMNLARLPFAHHHIALMPDAHQGYGMPIGGVVATTNTIIPNAVGVDIGCGMRAWDTGFPVDYFTPIMRKVFHDIYAKIPVGFNHHKMKQDMALFWEQVWDNNIDDCPIWEREYEKARYQLGTLGGGNHFIEAQACDVTGTVWFMIHSGSRNVGKQVCDHYNRLAVDLNDKYHSKVEKKWELAFLVHGTEEYVNYWGDMSCALHFAKANRAHMQNAVIEVLAGYEIPEGPWSGTIDVHHNYANVEYWYGKNVIVHRNGAVKARGTVIVPGSMGTASYIGEGLDNEESFGSCSHGAGRRMGRKAAAKDEVIRNTLDDMDTALFAKGDSYDEAPGAYKDIQNVMEQQQDLVYITHTLRPLAVIKG